jgi:hypothetical protein
MAKAVIARCRRLRNIGDGCGESQPPNDFDPQYGALLSSNLMSIASGRVRREVKATSDHFLGDCMVGLPRYQREHARPGVTYRERKQVASIPVLGKPSLTTLRATLTAAGFVVEKLALSGDREGFFNQPDGTERVVQETDAEVEYQVREMPPQKRLTTREAHRTIIRCFRAAGFDVGYGEVCEPNLYKRNCWSGSSLTGPRAWVEAQGPVAVAPEPDGDLSALPF